MVKFASPSCVCFISFGFLLATIFVWVWMVYSLHSVTTGSRDRATVPLKIIIIIIIIIIGMVITYTQQSMDQPGKVVNPARCQQL